MEIQILSSNKIESITSKRKNEVKLGEKINTLSHFNLDELRNSTAKFVILGVKESVGPRANLGKAGAESAWDAFLPKFLNIQSNRYLEGSECIVLGALDFPDLGQSEEINDLRNETAEIDQYLTSVLKTIFEADKIPIIIGGGHNNSYSNIKSAAKFANNKSISCINLDPHADFRSLEGRHSGNGFSYAKAEGYLSNYAIIGLHESYNSENMLQELNNLQVSFSTYEDIFLRDQITFNDAIEKALHATDEDFYGIELDLDAIENIASSAQTPSGISVQDARKYVTKLGHSNKAVYLHLCEAAPSLSPQPDQIGKLLAYLASDFIKARKDC